LGELAASCHAYAKALHYKEIEFKQSPQQTIEQLIAINNELQQPEAAVGILNLAQLNSNNNNRLEFSSSWYEKLQRWEMALEAYEIKQLELPDSMELSLGRMRCLRALGEWERLSILSKQLWANEVIQSDEGVKREIAPLAASAAWNLGEWDIMASYLASMDTERSDTQFFHAIQSVHRNEFNSARIFIDRCRELLDIELAGLVGESYNRAYRLIIQSQQIAELEEIITYKECKDKPQQSLIRKMWANRLKGCQRNVDIWQQILIVRSIVLSPRDDMPTWLKFSSLCRKSGRLALSLRVLTNLLGCDPNETSHLPTNYPQVTYSYLKHLWAAGYEAEAYNHMHELVKFLANYKIEHNNQTLLNDLGIAQEVNSNNNKTVGYSMGAVLSEAELSRLRGRACLRLGKWALSLNDQLNVQVIPIVLTAFHSATQYDSNYKVWHNWAVMNFRVVNFYKQFKSSKENKVHHAVNLSDAEVDNKIVSHVVAAVRGFFNSIKVAGDQSLQDILRLLTLWFNYGQLPAVEAALNDGFTNLKIDTWLSVIPQIIARIDTKQPMIRRSISELLSRIGHSFPQTLVYPLAVVAKSQSLARKTSALNVMNSMKLTSGSLVEQALMVSRELIRVAILWHEQWHEGLEEASRLYFGQKNIEGMLATLGPLHHIMNKGPTTLKEIGFIQSYGRDLAEASEWCAKYSKTGNDSDLNQAWDLYCNVFRKINKQLQSTTDLELQYVSPKLLSACNLELAMPGTYLADRDSVDRNEVKISRFIPSLKVIESKQRPRKIGIIGSDGLEYAFLLKGHEDLRQDKRVMQLFGLVNTLLDNDSDTSKKDLRIRGYSVIPLAPTSGLIQWLNECDTVHALIKDYRDARKILLNIEHRIMQQQAPDYNLLSLMQKVEVFEYALNKTTGQDLSKVLWLKSNNSEMWLDRRTNYTRSLAVMSMVRIDPTLHTSC
jgi:FKBP12-rapamycin complex-associated protein